MRQRLFWCSETEQWVNHPTKTPRRHGRGPMIMRDIEPYQNIIDGGVIGGRAQHREFLRKGNGETSYFELGNDKPDPKPVDLPDPDEAIQRAWSELGYD